MHHSIEVYERINRYERNAQRDYLMTRHRFRRTSTGARYLGMIWSLIRRDKTPKPELNDRQPVA